MVENFSLFIHEGLLIAFDNIPLLLYFVNPKFTVVLLLSGFAWVEGFAIQLGQSWGVNSLALQGLVFFAILGFGSTLLSIPFELYMTFVVEERFGFNKQTMSGFIKDKIKSLVLGSVLASLLLFPLLSLINNQETWWIWCWVVVCGFSLLVSWAYPTFLAPIFNKFSPLESGSLKEQIDALAEKVKFNASAVFIMDASTRTSHGNAYFTGVFGTSAGN